MTFLHCSNIFVDDTCSTDISEKITFDYKTIERKILKIFLGSRLYQLFHEIFKNKIKQNNNYLMEGYSMDSKIIQLLIQNIVDTGEYTLDGIAYHTRIPFDVIYDAVCGINNQFSITPWMRIVDLYLQVKPEVALLLNERLLEYKNKNQSAFSFLLNEP